MIFMHICQLHCSTSKSAGHQQAVRKTKAPVLLGEKAGSLQMLRDGSRCVVLSSGQV